MDIGTQRWLEGLIEARASLEVSTEALARNAQQLTRQSDVGLEDVADALSAIEGGLAEMSALVRSQLPASLMEAERLISTLSDGGAQKFERKFVHDLRNPLGVALGYSEILDETLEELIGEGGAPWAAHVRGLVTALSEHLQHFNRGLDELFSPRRLDAGRVVTLIPLGDTPPMLPPAPTPTPSEHPLGAAEPITRAVTPAPIPRAPSLSALARDLDEGLERQEGGEARGAEGAARPAARVLVVDDSASNRDLLCSMLKREGVRGDEASSAKEALFRLECASYDLILLDLFMPEVTGDALLQQLKGDPRYRRIPVLMISGDAEVETAIRCIELGAEDFLQKPFNRVLLRARISACIEKKRLADEMEEQNKRFKSLLTRILPAPVVKRLDAGESMIADRFQSVSILFSDLVGFTSMSTHMSPTELILTLDEVFSAFDAIAERFGVEKIKTIGDAYMAAAGLPVAREDHADAAVLMGVEMIKALSEIRARRQLPLRMRVGIHSGPVAAGIIGQKRFLYDVWGDTVNTASRLEASGSPDTVHISLDTRLLLNNVYELYPTGGVDLKGKGVVQSFVIKPQLELMRLKPLI
jgi:class 3 adenylate cyclase